jgi:microcystin-dependent protein
MCQGQILPIQQYTALFSLLGVNFGGNGTSNFGLPDLQGRMAMGYGDGPGLPSNNIGDTGGAVSQMMLTSNMPVHTHPMQCSTGFGNTATASNNYPSDISDSNGNPLIGYISDPAQATLTLNPLAVSVTGSGIPFGTQSPYLGLNYLIAMSGIFPTRP